jgi:hypothetical protein
MALARLCSLLFSVCLLLQISLCFSWTSSDSHKRRSFPVSTTLGSAPLEHHQSESIRFLGKGSEAVVKTGCVLVAPSYEFNHYYRKSAIFIYGMGTSDKDESGDYLIRGVILDHCTPFTVAEMMSQDEKLAGNPLGENLLFRGGDKGREDVILLHTYADLGQSSIGEGDDATGVYQGGWDAVLDACALGRIDPQSCKVFFNYVEFTEKQLESMMEDSEDGDAWMSLQVDSSIIMQQYPDRGDAWSRLRNAVSQTKLQS